MAQATAERTHTAITPPQGWQALNLRELWRYRHLLYYFVWRTVKVRYKQTVLGPFWAILQPFFTMVIFSVIFGGLAQIPSDGVPYPVFSFTALIPWTFFATSISNGTQSIVGNAGMMKKIYFPRLIVPVSVVVAALVDFAMAFVVLVLMIVVFALVTPVSPWPPFVETISLDVFGHFGDGATLGLTPNVLWLLPLTAMAFVTALGVVLWLASLNVQFRDVGHASGFVVRVWLFLTPVIYPSSLVSEEWRLLYALNPMTGVIEGFRWALLGTQTAPGPLILVSLAVSLALLLSGLAFFNRMEKTFADIV